MHYCKSKRHMDFFYRFIEGMSGVRRNSSAPARPENSRAYHHGSGGASQPSPVCSTNKIEIMAESGAAALMCACCLTYNHASTHVGRVADSVPPCFRALRQRLQIIKLASVKNWCSNSGRHGEIQPAKETQGRNPRVITSLIVTRANCSLHPGSWRNPAEPCCVREARRKWFAGRPGGWL